MDSIDLEDTESRRVSSSSSSSDEEEWKLRSTYVGGGGGDGLRGEEEEVLVHKTSSSKSMSGGSMTVEARERRARKSRVCFWRLNCDFHFLGFRNSDKRVMTGLVG